MNRSKASYVGLCIVLVQVALVGVNENVMANGRAKRADGHKGNFAEFGPLVWGACCIQVEVIAIFATGLGVVLARRRDLAWLLGASGAITLTCLVAGKVFWRESRVLW